MQPQHWWQNAQDRNAFARVLVDSDAVQSAHDLLYFYEKPWKWDREYDLWIESGKPTTEDAEGWEAFYDAVHNLVV